MPTLFPASVPFVDITNNLVSLIGKLNTYPLCKTVPIWWFTNISSKIPGIANLTIKDLKVVIINLLINTQRKSSVCSESEYKIVNNNAVIMVRIYAEV